MRITPRQYAEGLYESVKYAEVSARSALIDRFLALLSRDRRRRDIPFVFRHIERIAEREAGMRRVEIVSSKPLLEASLHAIEREGKKIFGEEKILFQQKIRPGLLGGAKFQTENETLDASVGGRLQQFKQFLEKGL
jgi:F0F1-type ATP synthase delta subunit